MLLAVVGANCNFIYANVGCQRRILYGGVFNSKFFKKCIDDNTVHLPPPSSLPQLSIPVPYVFVGDTFQLTSNPTKPFSELHDKGTIYI